MAVCIASGGGSEGSPERERGPRTLQRRLRKLVGAWEAAQGAAEAVAPFIVAYETSDGDFDRFFDSLTPEQQELFLSLAPLLLEIQIGLIELLGETADPEFIGRIYGMILYELLVDAAIAGAVAATGGTGSGGAGAAYGIRAINFASKLEGLGTFGKQAANLVDSLKPQIEQTLKLISEGGGGRKKLKDCRGDIRSPNQRVGSGNGGSLKNKMGELDEAARRARTDPVHGRPDVPEPKVDAPTTSAGPKFKNWNDFQAGTKGQFSSRADAAKAWEAYKDANGIVTGTVRSQAAKRQFLKSLADDPNTPSWMKSWLSEGRVPPGYEIDHIKPLSIGGPDTPANMRLQGIDLHRLHHYHYHPWRKP